MGWAGASLARAGSAVRGFDPHPPHLAVRGVCWQGWKDTNQISDLSSFLPGKAGIRTKGCRKSKPPGHPVWPGACGLHSQGVPVAMSVPLQFNCDPLRGLHAEWTSSHVGPHHQGRALVLGRGSRVFLGVQVDSPCPSPDTPLNRHPTGPCPLWEDETHATSIWVPPLPSRQSQRKV